MGGRFHQGVGDENWGVWIGIELSLLRGLLIEGGVGVGIVGLHLVIRLHGLILHGIDVLAVLIILRN